MEPLEVYIPTDRRQAMARGESLPDRAQGAVLFADISGFTPLTDALARELGPRRGAEELTQQLNRVYDALIAQIHRYGGSVIFFSGDAITCWFSGKDDPLSGGRGGTLRMKDEEISTFSFPPSSILHPPSSFRAVACALQLQQAMTQFAAVATPSGVTVSLAIKVAITAGPVRRFLVGDPDIQYLDVLAGQTLNRMAQIEHYAEKGEILVGAEIIDHLAGQVRVAEWRSDPESGQRFAAITGLVAPSAHLHPSGSPQSPPVPPPVEEIVDKGSYLYISFGAPLAHGDDASRAVAAALELRASPPALSFIEEVQIGLSQGRMRVGAYGSQTRRTYGVLGSEANIAA
ncbi:MAG: hypothetical protein HYR94_13985, partial [Chloroflexi bacterium]|nr:hypothetical protein [Chloroflexota bacterium]